jgi:hypothetical protein
LTPGLTSGLACPRRMSEERPAESGEDVDDDVDVVVVKT